MQGEAMQDSFGAAFMARWDPSGAGWRGVSQDFSVRSAVKPMPRRFGAGGFVSSRMAERMAVIASSWCWYLRSSSSSLRASAVLEASSSRSRKGVMRVSLPGGRE